ncbi:Vms1/Ankzf1 family peptidyl-tRNA hydrolase [Streptomyces sp. ME19-01-6]|uniref:baeRF2 domain-containing protein n=1 Tax=Streptomyces sp. ME19-01-6 TaxID=3028686 RepID=UPI0029A6FA20|nr:Vms1/Ankzf1 family peptidyl-tRNA hydrolase [Streptomyces sp. ME19-01-6]MDX3228806.1 Vms1/Ankzf1 family peptidyl-tRNA hydrolase [Streptomyces sp. ME19-01-6]
MQLGFLNPLFERPGPWATVYFDTSHHDQSSAEERERSARDACRRLERQGADQDTYRAVYDALCALPPAAEPVGRAVFATDGEVVLDPPLTTPPGGAHACWSALPHVGPLLDLGGDDPSCLVAYIDRRGADFELRGARGATPAGRLNGQQWPVHRTATADWSERHFQLKVENTWERNAARIADELRVCQEQTRADLLVLVGDARERRAVHDRLPERLRSAAVETDHGGRAPGSAPRGTHAARLLDRDVDEARARHTRNHVDEAVERFRAGRVPADGRVDAAEGVPALVDAAREHRIDTLLVRTDGADLYREVWVGAGPDQVALRRTDIQYLGDTRPSAARADDALIRSAATTGAEVVAVRAAPDAPDALPVGGLGALLRWPYGGDPAEP